MLQPHQSHTVGSTMWPVKYKEDVVPEDKFAKRNTIFYLQVNQNYESGGLAKMNKRMGEIGASQAAGHRNQNFPHWT